MKIFSVVFGAGMMISGLAMAATPLADVPQNQQQSQQAAPVVAGADTASTASTGRISTGQVIAVSIAVVAAVGVIAGVARDDHNNVPTGTTGTR